MQRKPIENTGKLRIVANQYSNDVYAIPEINSNIIDDPNTDENESHYITCTSCESIRQQMERKSNLQPWAVQGWDYVRVTESRNFHIYAPEKIKLLSRMGFEELQGGLWCRECGSTVLSKNYMKEHKDYVELSFTFSKGEKHLDKIIFKLPAQSSLKHNSTFSSLGRLIIYNDLEQLNDINIKSLGPSDYILEDNGTIIGNVKLSTNRDEISLTINKVNNSYLMNTTFSIYVHKIWFLKLETVDIYDILQTATYNIGNDKDIFYKKYAGYIKLDSYNPIHNVEDDWDDNWPIKDDEENGGGTNPGVEGEKNVLVWGLNNFGQLGDSTTIDRIVKFNNAGQIVTPAGVVLNLMMDAKRVEAGKDHAVALRDNNTVWVWGRNTNGQLGLGFRDDSNHSFPAQISSLNSVKDIAGGWFHTAALESNGTVWTWGGNYKGQLGDGTNTAKSRPVQVRLQDSQYLTGIKAIAAGSEHTIALDNTGRVWEWGEDHFFPKIVENLENIIAIKTGSWHSLALRDNGTVWAWGYNWSGQLGIGFEDHPEYMNEKGEYIKAIQVIGLDNIIQIDCGNEHSLALKEDGTLWSWGKNDKGQLGINTININKYYPVEIKGIRDIEHFSAGDYHNFVTLKDKRAFAWGANDKGQLCLNNYDLQKVPTFVENIPEVIYINCGSYHNFAIKITEKNKVKG